MATNLPYIPSPGTIKTVLDKIRTAATPERVTQDFIQTKLQIKGGTGTTIPPFLKKIGFVNSDGTPSDIYKRFRNTQTSGKAVGDAIRIGYKELFDVNEYCYELPDKDLLPLVCQVTGAAADSSAAKQTVACFRNLREYANFDATNDIAEPLPSINVLPAAMPQTEHSTGQNKVGLNLSYTINLNLPATSDQSVFNAIFRSLREHLLND